MVEDTQKNWLKSGATVIPNVLFENYQKLGFNSEQFVLFLFLKSEIDKGNTFPSANFLADQLGTNQQTVYNLLDNMIKNRLISIETKSVDDGKRSDSYNYDIVWDKLARIETEEQREEKSQKNELDERQLYTSFEQEFGRPLTPIEMETIGYWLDDDNYSLELIAMALREASLNQAYNLRYIDHILRSWEKKNIKTADDVKKESKQFRETRFEKSVNKSEGSSDDEMDVPIFNWLDNGKE